MTRRTVRCANCAEPLSYTHHYCVDCWRQTAKTTLVVAVITWLVTTVLNAVLALPSAAHR